MRGGRGQSAKNLRALQQVWDDLARRDPLWAVLTAPDKRGKGWDPAEFCQTGVDAVEGILAEVRARGLAIRRGRALDFGCGVGRLTQALARHLDEVWGVDIAPAMIELANSYNRFGERCRYVVNETGDLSRFPDNHFDFVLSLITLQHMPPDSAKAYLKEFVRVLAPGGVLVFQVAGEPIEPQSDHSLRGTLRRLVPGPVLKAYRTIKRGHRIEMYGVPREEVTKLLQEYGATLVAALGDTSAGREWTSFHYLAQKG